MKKVLALLIAVLLLVAITPVAFAASTVYVSVSVDGKLQVAAQPVSSDDLTVNGILKAAHKAYYSGGEDGYAAGIDKTWNMFLISKCWGVSTTPYVLINKAPTGSSEYPGTADTQKVKAGDNIVISLSSDPSKTARAVGLTASVADGKATVTATEWVLNLSTFQYSSSALANAAVVDGISGASLGTTDAKGSITVAIPESGIIAIDGLAAIFVGLPAAPAAEEPAQTPAAAEPVVTEAPVEVPAAEAPVEVPAAVEPVAEAPVAEVTAVEEPVLVAPSELHDELPQTGGASASTLIGLVGLGLILTGSSVLVIKKKSKSN